MDFGGEISRWTRAQYSAPATIGGNLIPSSFPIARMRRFILSCQEANALILNSNPAGIGADAGSGLSVRGAITRGKRVNLERDALENANITPDVAAGRQEWMQNLCDSALRACIKSVVEFMPFKTVDPDELRRYLADRLNHVTVEHKPSRSPGRPPSRSRA